MNSTVKTPLDFNKIVYNFLKINEILPSDFISLADDYINNATPYKDEAQMNISNYDIFNLFRSIIIKLNQANVTGLTKDRIYDLYDNQFITYCNNHNITLPN